MGTRRLEKKKNNFSEAENGKAKVIPVVLSFGEQISLGEL